METHPHPPSAQPPQKNGQEPAQGQRIEVVPPAQMESHLSKILTSEAIKREAGNALDPATLLPELASHYQKAIKKYLGHILRHSDKDAVQDAYQDLHKAFLIASKKSRPGPAMSNEKEVSEHDEEGEKVGEWRVGERFRDFLKREVRKVARKYQGKRPGQLSVDLPGTADDEWWDAEWRDELVRKAMGRLDEFQRDEQAKGRNNLFAAVLRLCEKFPEESDVQHAKRLTTEAGATCTYDAFRQQLARARPKLVEFLREEVRRAHPGYTDAQIDDELRDVRLGHILDAFRPEDAGDSEEAS